MDFKKLLNKLDSMDAPVATPAAPQIAPAVQLNEDAQLRVLSGRTTYVAEAKKQAEEDVKEEMKVGDKKASSTGGTIEKTKTGIKHTAGKNYGGDKAPKDEDEDAPKAKKKTAKESIDTEAFKSKFSKMVEAKKEKEPEGTYSSKRHETDGQRVARLAKEKMQAKKKKEAVKEGAKPDFLDMDKDGDKKEPMKSAAKDAKKGAAPKKGVNPFAKKDESVKEATKTDKPWTDMSGKKHTGTAVKGDKYQGKEAEVEAKSKKKTVKESVETKMSFRDMMKLVIESGGQQQIDPVDTALFAWAQRVAASKYTESTKAEVFAGMLYERNGGVFEMYDVLSEDQE